MFFFKKLIGRICKLILDRPPYDYERGVLNQGMLDCRKRIDEYEDKLRTLNPTLKRDTEEIRNTLGYINQYKMTQHHIQKQLKEIYLRSKK